MAGHSGAAGGGGGSSARAAPEWDRSGHDQRYGVRPATVHRPPTLRQL